MLTGLHLVWDVGIACYTWFEIKRFEYIQQLGSSNKHVCMVGLHSPNCCCVYESD